MEVFRDLMADRGFSLIEMLIALAVFSIGFLAVTAGVIAASKTNRTTAAADQAVMWGQDLTEIMAGIPLDASCLDVVEPGEDALTIIQGDRKAEITVFDAGDMDNDGRADFKTIGLKVWVKKGGQFSLRLENYYRRAGKS